jgi:predicted anti-sigma-YlaC factor YlaD
MIARARTRFKRFFARLQGRPAPPPSQKLDCRNVVALVTNYLEEQLEAEVRAAFDEHLTICKGCTNYVEQMRQTLGMLRALTEEPVFPETTEEFRQLFRTWRKEEDSL